MSGQDEGKDDLMEVDEEEEKSNDVNVEEMKSEPTDRKSNKPAKERNEDQCETKEVVEVEGEAVLTHSALRSEETSAHCM